MRKGEVVLQAGSRLTPSRIGLLAEMGISQVAARPRPTVAVLATGDELVPIDVEPGPGQIRNTNEVMLLAQVAQSGGVPVSLGIARDNREHLAACLKKGLQHDILVLSGVGLRRPARPGPFGTGRRWRRRFSIKSTLNPESLCGLGRLRGQKRMLRQGRVA